MYKTKPYKHQRKAVNRLIKEDNFALFMEMGTGKTKIIIDDASYRYERGLIDTLIIVCPNGLQLNWMNRELPVHMAAEYKVAVWGTTTKEKRAWYALYDEREKLRVFIINIDQLSRGEGERILSKVLRSAIGAILAVDESQRIKNHKANCTKALLRLGPEATYKRILSGTPVTQGPLDLWSQMRFLNPKILPFKTYTAFKHNYAIITIVKVDTNRLGFFEKITGYKNLDQLRKYIAPYSFIVKKKDCLDLPKKLFENIYVPLTAQQKRIYKEMVREAVAVIKNPPSHMTPEEMILWAMDSKGRITAANGLVKLLRCQQVLGGFVKSEDGTVERLDNNRLTILLEQLGLLADDAKVIIWARFVEEIKALKELLGDEAVTYYGAVNTKDRDTAVTAFQENPDIRYFIAQPASGGVGLTLTAASYVVWYSMDYSLEHYLQANDRAHRIGQTKNVTYLHLVSPKTLDERILTALTTKKRIAEELI
jgi:SNF2 family DNA or RNA helicase